MTCRLVVWNNKEIQDGFPEAKFTLFCCKMVKRIKPKHHLVVLNWAVLPVFLSLRPYWFLCKIVLWSDWPDPSDTILYKTGVYKARPSPEGLHCTRTSDSIWVQVQKQGQLTHHHLSSDTQEADTQPRPKSKSHLTLHTYGSQWGLHANIKVTSGKRGPRTYWMDQNEGRLRQPHWTAEGEGHLVLWWQDPHQPVNRSPCVSQGNNRHKIPDCERGCSLAWSSLRM